MAGREKGPVKSEPCGGVVVLAINVQLVSEGSNHKTDEKLSGLHMKPLTSCRRIFLASSLLVSYTH